MPHPSNCYFEQTYVVLIFNVDKKLVLLLLLGKVIKNVGRVLFSQQQKKLIYLCKTFTKVSTLRSYLGNCDSEVVMAVLKL